MPVKFARSRGLELRVPTPDSGLRRGVSKVEPERPWLDGADLQQTAVGPWILSDSPTDLVFVGGVDHMKRLAMVADWAAEQDESVLDEAVHECRMLVPGRLLTDAKRLVPTRAVDKGQREIRQRSRRLEGSWAVMRNAALSGSPISKFLPNSSYAAEGGIEAASPAAVACGGAIPVRFCAPRVS